MSDYGSHNSKYYDQLVTKIKLQARIDMNVVYYRIKQQAVGIRRRGYFLLMMSPIYA
jgi:hypothetical protein